MAVNLRVGAVREVPLELLRPWAENPRWISPERLEDLKWGMLGNRALLWPRPLIAKRDGEVLAGSHRLAAAIALGWKTIPVFVVDVSPQEARTIALVDNAHYAEWDEPSLAELLAGMEVDGVDLLLTGFPSSDLDRSLAGFQTEEDVDDAPSLPDVPESYPGEVYDLGPNRLLCGDAGDTEPLNHLLDGEQGRLLITDPPYGVSYRGKTAQALRIQNDDPAGLPMLLRDAFAAADAVLAANTPFYIFSPAGPLGTEFRLAVRHAGWQLHQSLVWDKTSIVLGHSDYHYQHEDILYGWKAGSGRGGRGRHAGSRWFGDNSQASVLCHARPVRSEAHPTMKPVGLIAEMVRNSSRRGDIVLDPFAGSGSTLIACEQLGRRCFAVEIDPAYCDVIRRRYAEYTSGR